MIQSTTTHTLLQLNSLLSQMNDSQYVKPLKILNNSTIGAHVRHILEFYKCLMKARNSAKLNYDHRERDKKLEYSVKNSIKLLGEIIDFVENQKKDFEILLSGNYCEEPSENNFEISTSFFRELLYNIEHAVHHMAIIKIGISEFKETITINEGFGIAASTLRYKKSCVQ